MDETKLHLTNFLLEEKKKFQRPIIGTFHILHKYDMTNYDLHETSFYIPVDTTKGRAKYGTTALKTWPLAVDYKIEPIILRYIQMKQKGGHPMNQNDVIDCANSLVTGSNIVTMRTDSINPIQNP